MNNLFSSFLKIIFITLPSLILIFVCNVCPFSTYIVASKNCSSVVSIESNFSIISVILLVITSYSVYFLGKFKSFNLDEIKFIALASSFLIYINNLLASSLDSFSVNTILYPVT